MGKLKPKGDKLKITPKGRKEVSNSKMMKKNLASREEEIFETTGDDDFDDSQLKREVEKFLKENKYSKTNNDNDVKVTKKMRKQKREARNNELEDIDSERGIKKLKTEKKKKMKNKLDKTEINSESNKQPDNVKVNHHNDEGKEKQTNKSKKRKSKLKKFESYDSVKNVNPTNIIKNTNNVVKKVDSKSNDKVCNNAQSKLKEKFNIAELKSHLNLDCQKKVDPKSNIKKVSNKSKSKLKEKFNVTELKSHLSLDYQKTVNKSEEMKKRDLTKTSKANEIKVPEKKKLKTVPTDRNTFKEQLMKQLQSSSFRIINEQMYTSTSSDAYKWFHDDPEAFEIYHEGYSNQVAEWPVNPLSEIASWLRKKPKNWLVADLGCGDASLAKSINQETISVDLIAKAPNVVECDMANTPFESNRFNVVVFCLSLMGTNLKEFIVEANRILVSGGVLLIAEVESRISDEGEFLKVLYKLGFRCIYKNKKQDYFWLFTLLKIRDVNLTSSTPELVLSPCIYKRR